MIGSTLLKPLWDKEEHNGGAKQRALQTAVKITLEKGDGVTVVNKQIVPQPSAGSLFRHK